MWRLDDATGYWDLQPYVQKQTAKGSWSKGRVTALKRLREELSSMPFLTPQDLEICAHIESYQDSGGYYYRRRETFAIEPRAFLALVGHPLVFWKGASGARIDVVKGEVRLDVSKSGDSVGLTLSPAFSPEAPVVVVKESYTRVAVYEITDTHRHLARVLGEGLRVPTAQKERMAKALDNIASHITVNSDVGGVGTTLREIAADSQPEVQLLPFEAGLRAQLVVRPLGKGSHYRPGQGAEVVLAEVDGERVQARRDMADERRRMEDVVAACPTLAREMSDDGEWLLPDPDAALELLLELRALGDAARVVWPQGERLSVTHSASAGQFSMNITSGADWFGVKGKLELDDSLVLDMKQLIEHIAASPSRFVPLGDGQFLALTKTFRRRLEDLRAYAEERDGGLRLHPLAAAALEELAEEAGSTRSDRKWKEHLRRLRDMREFVPSLPNTLRAELRDYQLEGFQWMARLAHWGVGACLADDMGLGKTVQALALMLAHAGEGPCLAVAPTSVCPNWIEEARRFAPTLKPRLFGPGDRKKLIEEAGPFDLVVCSYSLMQQDEALLTSRSWRVIVLDEAQAIKNRATKRSKAAMKLEGDFKLITTGIPVENHLGELWNLFRFINPGLLGSFERFNNRFAAPIERDRNHEARGRLKRLIQPFILRRVKEQVLEELPPRTEITLRVELSKPEAAFYEALRQEAVAALDGGGEQDGQAHLRILAQLMRLRRACCNTALVTPDAPLPSAKLEVFGAVLDELLENRHKALVFSQFVDHLTLIREFLDEKGVSYQYLDGSTPAGRRKKRVDAFQGGEGDLFLISLKAGGLGLNLTAADYVIHMDPWWNPAVEDQASDRSHRIGQERPVTIYRLVTQNTIEEKIVDLHQRKRDLADSLLEGSDMAGKMSAEDLLALLREPPTATS